MSLTGGGSQLVGPSPARWSWSQSSSLASVHYVHSRFVVRDVWLHRGAPFGDSRSDEVCGLPWRDVRAGCGPDGACEPVFDRGDGNAQSACNVGTSPPDSCDAKLGTQPAVRSISRRKRRTCASVVRHTRPESQVPRCVRRVRRRKRRRSIRMVPTQMGGRPSCNRRTTSPPRRSDSPALDRPRPPRPIRRRHRSRPIGLEPSRMATRSARPSSDSIRRDRAGPRDEAEHHRLGRPHQRMALKQRGFERSHPRQ